MNGDPHPYIEAVNWLPKNETQSRPVPTGWCFTCGVPHTQHPPNTPEVQTFVPIRFPQRPLPLA